MQKLEGAGHEGIDRHAATKAACSHKQARAPGRPLGMGGAENHGTRHEEGPKADMDFSARIAIDAGCQAAAAPCERRKNRDTRDGGALP